MPSKQKYKMLKTYKPSSKGKMSKDQRSSLTEEQKLERYTRQQHYSLNLDWNRHIEREE